MKPILLALSLCMVLQSYAQFSPYERQADGAVVGILLSQTLFPRVQYGADYLHVMGNEHFSYEMSTSRPFINNKLYAGFYFNVSKQKNALQFNPSGEYKKFMLGIHLEQMWRKGHQRFYFSSPVNLGWGKSEATGGSIPFDKRSMGHFGFLETEFKLNFSFQEIIGFSIGPGYRWTLGSSVYGMDDKYLTGFTAQASIWLTFYGADWVDELYEYH